MEEVIKVFEKFDKEGVRHITFSKFAAILLRLDPLLTQCQINLLQTEIGVTSDGTVDLDDAALFTCDCFNLLSTASMERDASMLLYAFAAPYDLVGRYSIKRSALCQWIVSIADQYQAHPYHNWQHALDVTQLSHYCLTTSGAKEYFNYQDVMALLCAAMGHDVGHKGVNNAFLVSTRHELALTCNDRSPLENMHASVVFNTLRRPRARDGGAHHANDGPGERQHRCRPGLLLEQVD